MSVYDLLFGDQPVEAMLLDAEFGGDPALVAARARAWEGNPSEAANAVEGVDEPWASLVVAVARQSSGQSPKVQLRTVAEDATLDSRPRLWAWTALRKLGEKPGPIHASEVLGCIAEVPVDGDLDVLACYADGSTRLLGQGGQCLATESSNGPSPEVEAVLAEAAALLPVAPAPRDPADPGPDPNGVRLWALSARGLHRVDAPWADVEQGGRFEKLFKALLALFEKVASR